MADSPNPMPSDADLVVRCQRHDPEAFRILVERYRRRSWKVAYNLLGNMEVARDISQEAFIRVLRAIATCDPNRGFRQWFDKVVVNLSIDYLRKHGSVQAVPLELISEPATSVDSPEDRTLQDETRMKVRAVLGELPLKHRAVLMMRDIDGMECEEIAVALGKTPGTIRWRLNQARQAFRRAWERSQREMSPDA